MKKLNNKGFAVSTILYGVLTMALLITALMISHMSNNRQNTSTLVKNIESELNRYTRTNSTLVQNQSSQQEYIVPQGQSGWYKIELWGSGNPTETDASIISGKGAYTSGIIYLDEFERLYFNIGSSTYNGGYSDVRTDPSSGDGTDTLASRIMYAAPASGATPGGSLLPFQNENLGISSSGNTSYISGYAGTEMNNNEYKTARKILTGYNSNNEPTYDNKNYSFIDGIIVYGANGGTGSAKIEKLSSNGYDNPPSVRTSKLDGVKKVEICFNSSTKLNEVQITTTTNTSSSLSGRNIRKNIANATYSDGNIKSGTTTTCAVAYNGSAINVDEIAIWAKDSNQSTASLSIKINDQTFKNSSSVIFTPTGYRISRYQITPTDTLINGNYYIVSANSETAALTSTYTEGNTESAVKMRWLKGDQPQKWRFENISGNMFKVLDTQFSTALQTSDGSYEENQSLITSLEAGNILKSWENWYFDSTGDGYYKISVATSSDGDGTNVLKRLYLTADSTTKSTGTLTVKNEITDSTKKNQQKFRIINAN